jgi:hypothetical protein
LAIHQGKLAALIGVKGKESFVAACTDDVKAPIISVVSRKFWRLLFI